MLSLLLNPQQALKLRYFLVTAQVARNPETIAFLANLKEVLSFASTLEDDEFLQTAISQDILLPMNRDSLYDLVEKKGQ